MAHIMLLIVVVIKCNYAEEVIQKCLLSCKCKIFLVLDLRSFSIASYCYEVEGKPQGFQVKVGKFFWYNDPGW